MAFVENGTRYRAQLLHGDLSRFSKMENGFAPTLLRNEEKRLRVNYLSLCNQLNLCKFIGHGPRSRVSRADIYRRGRSQESITSSSKSPRILLFPFSFSSISLRGPTPFSTILRVFRQLCYFLSSIFPGIQFITDRARKERLNIGAATTNRWKGNERALRIIILSSNISRESCHRRIALSLSTFSVGRSKPRALPARVPYGARNR